MRLKLLFVIGLATGYVVGARAGRERYLKIKEKATEAWEDPRVQKAVHETETFVRENAPIVAEKVSEGAKAAAEGAKSASEKVAVGAMLAADQAKAASEKVADGAKAAAAGVKDAAGKVAESSHDLAGRVSDGAKGVAAKVTGSVDEGAAATQAARDSAANLGTDNDTATGTGNGTEDDGHQSEDHTAEQNPV